MIKEIVEAIKNGHQLTYEEAVDLCNTDNKQLLYDAANEVRLHFCGTSMDMCSIANARSGQCSEDCKWCSQSKFHKTGIKEYESISPNEAVKMAVDNHQKGVHRFSLVTSGKTVTNLQLQGYLNIYKEIKNSCSISLCASMGLLSREQLRKLKETGVEHYHCNIESAPSFFSQLCTTHTIEEKVQTIKWAQQEGLKVCSGGIIGMGETMDQRIEMALYLRELNIKSIPINILMPIEGTPLSGTSQLLASEILTTMAIFRLINVDAKIRFAGGRQLIKTHQTQALLAGVNAALVGDYLTTIGSTTVEEDKRCFEGAGFSLE